LLLFFYILKNCVALLKLDLLFAQLGYTYTKIHSSNGSDLRTLNWEIKCNSLRI
jgi:hypothetical protein